ncbi:MAG: S41 family peptidase [Prevotella sp.]|nr:S41 family peptidase [Prevotella sp.]
MKKMIFLIAMLIAIPTMAQNSSKHNFEVAKNMNVFNSIYKALDLMYVDTLNANEVIGNGINAMLRSLDPYTEYYPEDKVKELKMMITGKYAGIGALIKYNYQLKRVVIDEPYENMPAAEAGLRKGDIILAIDKDDVRNKDNQYVSEHLRGDAGTSFILKIHRPATGKDMKIKITRKAIQLPAVPYYGMQKDSIGYINLSQFTTDCSKDVRRAFIELKNKGAKGLVFDLRGNGGGSLSEAVSIVNMFVPKNLTVVTTKGKVARSNSTYKTTVEPIDTVMPIVMLVNGSTASASEITSGSLQDFDRAVVVGTRTYGKGLVQMTMDLPYNGNMKLTTSHYYIPSGRCIQAINYKHSNGGYMEHVPDSLTKEFKTAHGRTVRDGGGIRPDVEVVPDSLPNIAYYLVGVKDSNEVLLNYVIDYVKNHPTIATPDKFEITDADFKDFKERVLKANFKYDGQSSKSLEALEKIAKFEGYYDDAKKEFEALKKKLDHNVAKDLEYNKEYIKQLLANDIVAIYYFQRGTIENQLRYDKTMKEAVKILKDKKRYSEILSGK